jgi:hypothetical protein
MNASIAKNHKPALFIVVFLCVQSNPVNRDQDSNRLKKESHQEVNPPMDWTAGTHCGICRDLAKVPGLNADEQQDAGQIHVISPLNVYSFPALWLGGNKHLDLLLAFSVYSWRSHVVFKYFGYFFVCQLFADILWELARYSLVVYPSVAAYILRSHGVTDLMVSNPSLSSITTLAPSRS